MAWQTTITLGIQSPSENGNRLDGRTPQSLSDDMTGCLGNDQNPLSPPLERSFQLIHTHRIHGTNGIFTYIYHKNQPNVGKYTIHASYGILETSIEHHQTIFVSSISMKCLSPEISVNLSGQVYLPPWKTNLSPENWWNCPFKNGPFSG